MKDGTRKDKGIAATDSRRDGLSPRQIQFLTACKKGTRTLGQIMHDMGLEPYHLARWTTKRAFRKKLGAMRRYLLHARRLEIDVGAMHAARRLSEIVSAECSDRTPGAQMREIRSACGDVLRLAADLARHRIAANPPPDEAKKQASLFHPALSEVNAAELMRELGEKA